MSAWYWLMGQLPFEWAGFTFMQNALLAVLLVSPMFALIGCLVINNQMAFFSEAVGHATLTGIALGVLLGLTDPSLAIIAFAVALALTVSYLRRYSAISTDTLIGLVMSFSIALGVVLLSRGGGFAKYSRYLVGDLLTVTPAEIGRLALVFLLVAVLWGLYFNRFLLTFFNHPLAQSRGVNVWRTEAFFSSVVALVVAASIQWVGLLVVNSLIIIPAATSRNISVNSRQYVLNAVLLSLASALPGLVLSFYWGTATGATVVLVAMALYFLSFLFRR